MQTSSALMHGFQNTKVTSRPVPMYRTVEDLHARVAQTSCNMFLITEVDAVAALGAPANRAVAILMAPSSFLAH